MKLFKKIISLLLIFTLTLTNVRLDFPVVTEYNETISVDETIQLKIPGGATKIEWETSSKRIAKVTNDGKVTGVKKGTCDVNCRAEYSKFVFFKDVVNYVFHITVVDKVTSNVDDDRNTRTKDINTTELLKYQNNDNAYYLSGVSENFTFDIWTDSNVESSYTIKDVEDNLVATKTQKTNIENTWTIMPNDKYNELTTYIVDLNGSAKFVSDDYSEYTTLIFMTTGKEQYSLKYNNNVAKDVIKVDDSNITKQSSDGKEVYEIHDSEVAKYNVGQIIITENPTTNKKMPYKIVSKNNDKVIVEVPKIDEIYDEFSVHTKGPIKLGTDNINNDKRLMKAIKNKVLDLFVDTVYARDINSEYQIGDTVYISTVEKDDGTIVFRIEIEAKKISDHITGKIVFNTSFKLNHEFNFDIFKIKNTVFEIELSDLVTDLSFTIDTGAGAEIDDHGNSSSELLSKILNKPAETDHWESEPIFHKSGDLIDLIPVVNPIRNEIEKALNFNVGVLGFSIDVNIVNYIAASIQISLRGNYSVSLKSGISAIKGVYSYETVKSKMKLEVVVLGKIRDTVQLPRIKAHIYAFTDLLFDIGIDAGPQIDLVLTGRYKFSSDNITRAGTNAALAGYLSVSCDVKVTGYIHIDLFVDRIYKDTDWINFHLFDIVIGDIVDIFVSPNEFEINENNPYVPIKNIYKTMVDTDSEWLDLKEEPISPNDSNLRYYLDSGKTKKLSYTNWKGVYVQNPPGENFDIYIEYSSKFNIKFNTVCHVTTTMLPTTTVIPTTIPMTTVPPETTAPPETTIPPETTVPPMTGNSKIEGMVQAIIPGTTDTQTVQNANIKFYNNNNPNQLAGSIFTDANGKFSTNLQAGTYTLVTSAAGYVTLESTETLLDNETKYVEIYILFSENETGNGSASGKVINAVTGDAIEGVRISLRKGWNKNSGEYAVNKTFKTNSNGNYTIDNVNVGYYTVEFVKEGFTNEYKNILILHSKPITDYNTALNPILTGEGDLRIVLRWGEKPNDLDSHLIGKRPDDAYFNVYWKSKKYDYQNIHMANLDLDDTTSYGPETITITNKISGNYIYGVHDYTNRSNSNSKALSNSNCNVTVYVGNTAIKKFNVPTNRVGTFWEVFSIDENYHITAINQIYNYNPLYKDFSRFSIDSGDWDGGTDYSGISVGVGNDNNVVIGSDLDENITTMPKNYAISSTENVSYSYDDINSAVKIKIIKPKVNGYNYQVINENMDDVIEDIKTKVEEYINENEDQIKSITFNAPVLEVSSGDDIRISFIGDVKYKDNNVIQLKYSLDYNVVNDEWQVDLVQ